MEADCAARATTSAGARNAHAATGHEHPPPERATAPHSAAIALDPSGPARGAAAWTTSPPSSTETTIASAVTTRLSGHAGAADRNDQSPHAARTALPIFVEPATRPPRRSASIAISRSRFTPRRGRSARSAPAATGACSAPRARVPPAIRSRLSSGLPRRGSGSAGRAPEQHGTTCVLSAVRPAINTLSKRAYAAQLP